MFDVGCSSGFMGQGEGSSEILQTGLDRVVVPKMRPLAQALNSALIAGLNCLRVAHTFPARLNREHGAGRNHDSN